LPSVQSSNTIAFSSTRSLDRLLLLDNTNPLCF